MDMDECCAFFANIFLKLILPLSCHIDNTEPFTLLKCVVATRGKNVSRVVICKVTVKCEDTHAEEQLSWDRQVLGRRGPR